MAREVTVGPDGLANGVSYIDKNTGADEHVRAKVVVLAASAMETRAAAAELQVDRVPERARQLERHRRQVSHRHDRRGRLRTHSGDGGPHSAQPRRRRRHARVHAVVARQQEARFPARLSHRGVRRRRAAGVRIRRRHSAPQRRRVRQAAQGRLSQVLRRVDRVRRPRRDDSRTRTRTASSIRTSSIEFGIPVLRFHWKFTDYEYNQAKHMQETFRSLIVAMGGTPYVADADARAGLRSRRGRHDHPRAGRRAHGQRSEDVGRQRELPGARREESVRRRRQPVRLAGRQESDVDDPRALVAHERLHRASSGRRGRYEHDARRPGREGEGTTSIRRDDLPPARARRCSAPCRLPRRSEPGDRARSKSVRTATSQAAAQAAPQFFNAHEWKTVRVLVDYIIPRDDRSGSATDAKVPEYMDFLLAEKDANPATQVAMHGGLAWLDTECRKRFQKTFVDATRRAAAAGARRHRVSAEGASRR